MFITRFWFARIVTGDEISTVQGVSTLNVYAYSVPITLCNPDI